jgi:hypothetical protein
MIPRRTAHATHALLTASKEHNMPVTAAEVCIYDEEALSVRSTGSALREARVRGLAVFTGLYWIPTNFALDLRREFEERFLADTEREGDR